MLALAGVVLVAATFGDLFEWLGLAALLAAGLHPVVRFLERRGVPRGLAVPLTFLGLLGLGAGALVVVVPLFVEQATALFQALPASAAEFEKLSRQWDVARARLGFLPTLPEVTEWFSTRAGDAMRGVLGWTGQVAGFLATAASVALLLYYLLSDGRRFREHLLLVVPPHHRAETRTLLTQLTDRVGRFTLGTALDMSIVGLLTAAGLWLVGVPNALALGVIVGVFNVLPYIGALLGAVPALLVAFSLSPQVGFSALGVIAVIQLVEGYVLYPKVVGDVVGLHPLYVFVALAAGAQLWGVAGVFLGIPAAVVIKTLLEAWVVPRVERMAAPPTARVRLATKPGEVTLAPPAVSITRFEPTAAPEPGTPSER